MTSNSGELSASDISSAFDSTPSAISQHLKVLREAHLITMHKRAQYRMYRLESTSMAEAEQWLNSRLQLWNDRIDTMETYIKNTKEKA